MQRIGQLSRHQAFSTAWVLLIFLNFMARSRVCSIGYSVDDYALRTGADFSADFFAQMRFAQAGLGLMLQAAGVNLLDCLPLLGALSLLLQPLLSLAVLDFIGVSHLFGLVGAGALMVLHPYASEILTFRVAVPPYVLLMLLLCCVLRLLRNRASACRRFVSVFLCVLGLFSYQIIFNYLILICFLSYMAYRFDAPSSGTSARDNRELLRLRFSQLLAVTCTSLVVFFGIGRLLCRWVGFAPNSRTQLIPFASSSARAAQVWHTIKQVFVKADCLIPHWSKFGLLVLLTVAGTGIAVGGTKHLRGGRRWLMALVTVLVLGCAAPLSLGVSVAIDEWWPAFRILSQVSLLFALAGLAFDNSLKRIRKASPTMVFLTALWVCQVFQFIAVNNLVFSDQHRMNAWDAGVAVRIVQRLEEQPEYSTIQRVYISGVMPYPAKLRTTYMDMNLSAWWVPWAKLHVLNASTGMAFEVAKADEQQWGQAHCAHGPVWPDARSVTVSDGLAVVCLPQS